MEHFWGCKISMIRTFIRSDLVIRKWNHLISTPNQDLRLRDAQLYIVRDNSKTIRLELTEDELAKYTNQAFRDHVKKKTETATTVP